ncbi:MAG: DUF3667 domain-containing protein [Muribaculaceae bacterium]|nr:DUF3667 domain-containing protein [Muribaculaceae bacterium]
MKHYKDYKSRFENWQLDPIKYEYPGEKHRCDCCGEMHEGNFCPLCGQKATHGPITWKSVWAGVMEIWGLHSRSLPYTAWQLLTRPGHLMRDYVTGKRQVSFPPVKMLVILGVIVFLIGHWLNPKDYSHEIKTVTSTGALYYVEYAFRWLTAHSEWFLLVVFSMFILPTWWVFRHAPLLKRHTLPQGFFIQVFLVNQNLVIELLLFLLLLFFPSTTIIEFVLLFSFWLIDYKQLFGYNWWGTIWRWIMMFVLIMAFILALDAVTNLAQTIINPSSSPNAEKYGIMFYFGLLASCVAFLCLLYALLYSINTINRKSWLERGKWNAWKIPVKLLIVVVVALVVLAALSSF